MSNGRVGLGIKDGSGAVDILMVLVLKREVLCIWRISRRSTSMPQAILDVQFSFLKFK